MNKINVIKLFLCLILSSCVSSQQNSRSVSDTRYDLPVDFYTINYLLENEDCKDEAARGPSAVSCRARIASILQGAAPVVGDTVLARTIVKDSIINAEVVQPTRSQLDNTVALTTPMKQFREKYLRFFAPNYPNREALVRSFEASFRMRSDLVARRLKNSKVENEYDLVIIGTGVHGVLALHEALKENPKLKILLVDEGDTAGATFRYGKDFFNINSSNRETGPNTKPLPGQGNLNELPGLPIQVSDMTAVKYPTANDLGSALVTGLYAALKAHPQVDVLFGAKANKIVQDAEGKKGLDITVDNQNIQVSQQVLIISTGLGTPTLPPKVRESVRSNPKLIESRGEQKLPNILTFEDLVRIVANSNDPKAFFRNKRIAVVGDGDSANVSLEYFLGLATKEAYASSSAQGGRPEKIYWIGQQSTTCKEFISKARQRYAAIGKGFDSSDSNFAAILEANPSKLDRVKETPDNIIDLTLEDGTQFKDVDFVVFSVGFNQNVRGLFGEILPEVSSLSTTDKQFFGTDNFRLVEEVTRTSKGQKTSVAVSNNDRDVFVLGTAAGKLASDKDLVGVIQNFVSIFNNAPRVVAGTDVAVSKIKPNLASASVPLNLLPFQIKSGNGVVKVTEVNEARIMPTQTLSYVKSVFQESLLYLDNPNNFKLDVTIALNSNGELIVSSNQNRDITAHVELLAATREFFSLSKELLRRSPTKMIRLTADSNGGRFRALQATLDLVGFNKDLLNVATDLPVVTNGNIKLRGLREDKPVVLPPVVETLVSNSLQRTGVAEIPIESGSKKLTIKVGSKTLEITPNRLFNSIAIPNRVQLVQLSSTRESYKVSNKNNEVLSRLSIVSLSSVIGGGAPLSLYQSVYFRNPNSPRKVGAGVVVIDKTNEVYSKGQPVYQDGVYIMRDDGFFPVGDFNGFITLPQNIKNTALGKLKSGISNYAIESVERSGIRFYNSSFTNNNIQLTIAPKSIAAISYGRNNDSFFVKTVDGVILELQDGPAGVALYEVAYDANYFGSWSTN